MVCVLLFNLHFWNEPDYKLYREQYYRKTNHNIKRIADAVLILHGDQGIGKSTAISSLLPYTLNNYIGSQHINFRSSNQADIANMPFLFCELGEIDALIAKYSSELKDFISSSKVHARKAYGRFAEDIFRKTIFFGTSNYEAVLKDITGSRRFFCITINEKLNLTRKNKFMQQLWAELYHKVLNFELTPFVDKVFDQSNYRYRTVTEDLILENYEIDVTSKGSKAMSLKQICSTIYPDRVMSDTEKGKVLMALTALKVKQKRQKRYTKFGLIVDTLYVLKVKVPSIAL
jgi:predicted P-loop ATPase